MKTDGLFDFKVCQINGKYGEDINIIFWGDEHVNSPAFARGEWEDDCKELEKLSRRENTWFIKTGDVFEALSTTERHTFSNGGFHDSNITRWEKEYAREIDEYVNEAQFQVGKTLAVYGGNHFFQFYDGSTSDMALANRLKAPYIGVCGYLILSIKIDEYHSHVVKIFVHHGKGSGKRIGSSLNAPEDASTYFSDADIVVMGHDHKPCAAKISDLCITKGRGDNWKVKHRDRIIGRSGSYLKSYEAGKKSYSTDAMYRPSSLGYLRVVVTPYKKFSGGRKNRSEERGFKLRAVI